MPAPGPLSGAPPPHSPPFAYPSVVVNDSRHTQSVSRSSKIERGPKIISGPRKTQVKGNDFLSRERRSASAAAGRIRVLKGKARAHHIGRVVDGYTVKVLGRKHIDKEADALLVHDKIARLGLFLNVKTVLKARASTRHDAYAKARAFRQIVLAGEKLFDLFGGAVGNDQFNGR